MDVYFISGLAADRRVFKHIKLPEGFNVIHLEWISPKKNESLEAYANRLAKKIDHRKKFGLIGLSMGGMIATEIAKTNKPVFTVLISSAATCKQFPRRFKVSYFLRLHKLIPSSFFKSISIIKRYFSSEHPDDKVVLRQIIKDSDPMFIRWALEAILGWKNEEMPGSYIHIHGTNDKVLPMRFTKPTHIIKGGGHLMVMSKAKEVNKILNTLSPA